MIIALKNLFNKNNKTHNFQKKLNITGQKILSDTYKRINLFLKNEI